MNRQSDSRTARRSSAFARLLALLLLAFIVYGTTVEAAHTHGSLTRASNVSAASNFSEPGTETKATNPLLGCGDCLICQLHQHFSATLISGPPSLGQSTLKSRIFSRATVSVLSKTNTPRTGRAPPQNS